MQPTPLNPAGKKRLGKWLIGAGIPLTLLVIALIAGTVLRISDPAYRSDLGIQSPAREQYETKEGAPPMADSGYSASEGSVEGNRAPGRTVDVPDAVPETSTPERVVKSGELSIAVSGGDIQQAYLKAGAIARELGGYIASSSTSTGSRGNTASIVVKIPVERFEEMTERASALGEIRSMSASGEDVSTQFVDLEARLRNLEAQRDQILTLMSQAKSVQETITIQDRLFSVTEQIERIKGQRKTLESKTAYSTLNITLSQASAPLAGEGWGTGKALSRASHAFVDTLNGFIVIMGPLAFLGLLALMIWFPARVALRRRRNHNALATEVRESSAA